FNSLIKLDEKSNRPHNPMINAGAIATASLIHGDDPTDRLKKTLAAFNAFAGRELNVDMSVFVSERSTGHRNRAIAHLMLNFGMIDPDIDTALDLYFQQCSILVNAHDLAVTAATLANDGINPLTKQRAIKSEYIRDVLSLMYTCGMYDYAGEWAYTVGLPAKSGVGGGIMAVVPGKMGIAIFSPPLDSRGNSVRGIKVCQAMSADLGLHMFASNQTAEVPLP
ncbi:MAG: glutaminase, partial [Phycisphaerales bacterium]|nr:glutaminase [Phycisphaerales bacterium]